MQDSVYHFTKYSLLKKYRKIHEHKLLTFWKFCGDVARMQLPLRVDVSLLAKYRMNHRTNFREIFRILKMY